MNSPCDIRGFTGTVISIVDEITVKVKSDLDLPNPGGFKDDPRLFCISAAYIEKTKQNPT